MWSFVICIDRPRRFKNIFHVWSFSWFWLQALLAGSMLHNLIWNYSGNTSANIIFWNKLGVHGVHTVATVHTSSLCGCDMGPSEGGIRKCRHLETRRAYKSRSARSTARRIKTRRTSQERVHGGHGVHRALPFFPYFQVSKSWWFVCICTIKSEFFWWLSVPFCRPFCGFFTKSHCVFKGFWG
jgi:hypothetical protein